MPSTASATSPSRSSIKRAITPWRSKATRARCMPMSKSSSTTHNLRLQPPPPIRRSMAITVGSKPASPSSLPISLGSKSGINGPDWRPSAKSSASVNSPPRPRLRQPITFSAHPLSAERFSNVVRSHWGVENRLHWCLDVIMNEDQARNRLDNGPHNLAVLRHMALNVMRKDDTKSSLRGKFKLAGWNDEYLAKLIAQF